ncbi:MAG: hypothetical protein AB7L17_20285 [Ilumatobacteraceae bacterium]
MERAGFGIAVRPEDCTPEVARELAERLIVDDALREAAQQQQAAIASMATPDDVAAGLTDRFDS